MSTKTIEEQKKEWQAKYGVGNCRELIADGKSVFVFDPTIDFNKAKAAIAARSKGVSYLVDSILNNCWLGGDESLKKDEAFKQGIEMQVDEILELPDVEVTDLPNGNVLVTVGELSVELRKVTRQDLRYADDRNTDDKVLRSNELILERISIDKETLSTLIKNVRAYLAVLIKLKDLKDIKYVSLKKF